MGRKLGPVSVVLAGEENTGLQFPAESAGILAPIGWAPAIAHCIRAISSLDPDRILVDRPRSISREALAGALHMWAADVLIAETGDDGESRSKFAGLAACLEGVEGSILFLAADFPLIRSESLRRLVDAAVSGNGFSVLRSPLMQGAAPQTHRSDEMGPSPDPPVIVTCLPMSTYRKIATSAGVPLEGSGHCHPDLLARVLLERNIETACITLDPEQAASVRTPDGRAHAESLFQDRARSRAIAEGVVMQAPDSVWFAVDNRIEPGAVLEPQIVFGPGVVVRSGAIIRAFSHLEGCEIGSGAVVGPHARLRPGTVVSDGARVGNFVEVKASSIGRGSRVSHLAYVGDTTIDGDANIGAGTITCNFDGMSKHRTFIGERAFVGSNTTLVAPVRVGREAMTGAGSVITREVPDEALAIARTRQENIQGRARRLMDRIRAVAGKSRDPADSER
ncbi:MAG: NTP transferase domain-containing protein [Paracoccaceae bacterium]|nr:NTP transferase domain-containing protein [Paracoccaceae bacterium]